MSNIALKSDATFDELLAAARNKFGAIKFEEVKVGDNVLELAQVADMPAYLDRLVDKARGGKKVDLPLWAKIWPSCLVLGFYVLKFKAVEDASFLEVGTDGGLCGMLAAGRGFNVTLADTDDDALLFARLNVMRNNLEDKIKVCKISFSETDLSEKFNYILGCEILHRDDVAESLPVFLGKHLAGGKQSEVLLAMDKKRSGRKFFDGTKENYRLMKQEVPFVGNNGEGQSIVSLIRMGAK
ncbi:class I SAM-dependent methyltransferase [Maridesulfovibrio hydrothermalis]|uniref:Methyltransferase small n=1 Tax=Maridesulfovibrio hydrothermalis AM13 = DSM 14728 TaxID=1121451 RepID=L0RDW7_9BACT|nr:methyltransferase [Maridesulfovibrio hydrothermalis]CCO24973.1 Methyltransferase small [Maridesulfovibrio hydrothermalis AM13 = DSM 14728]